MCNKPYTVHVICNNPTFLRWCAIITYTRYDVQYNLHSLCDFQQNLRLRFAI